MADDIASANAELIAISPQTLANNTRVVERHRLGFPLFRDEGNAVADEFGLRFTLPDDLRAIYESFGIDLPDVNGEPSWTLPMPARYVVDGSGVIRYARVHPDYTRRPEPAETIEALRTLH